MHQYINRNHQLTYSWLFATGLFGMIRIQQKYSEVFSMNLSQNIKRRREELKLSQEYVAQQLGVSRQAVSKWETGQSEPTANNLIQLTEVFEISLSELVNPQKRDGEQETSEKRLYEKTPNLILRANLTKWAIILQAAFIQSTAVAVRGYLNYPDGRNYIGLVIFNLTMLTICSLWMASNHRFETDMCQRRRNINIELGYCILQAFVMIFDTYFDFRSVATIIIIAVGLVYILYVNPKFMSRKLTK